MPCVTWSSLAQPDHIAAGGSNLTISLFDAKTEVVRLASTVASGSRPRTPSWWSPRSSMLDGCLTAAGMRKPGFTRDDQLRFAAGRREGTLVDRLLHTAVPLAGPREVGPHHPSRRANGRVSLLATC